MSVFVFNKHEDTRYGASEPVERIYVSEELANDVTPEEYSLHLKTWHPVKYKMQCAAQLVRRGLCKMKRMIIK